MLGDVCGLEVSVTVTAGNPKTSLRQKFFFPSTHLWYAVPEHGVLHRIKQSIKHLASN